MNEILNCGRTGDIVTPKPQNLSQWSAYQDKPIVWLTEFRTFGWLLEEGAYHAKVVYTADGIDYEDLIEKDEYEYWDEHATDYERE